MTTTQKPGGDGTAGSLDGTYVLPCSFGQQRLWFLDGLDPASGRAYLGHAAVRLRGALDERLLQRAVDVLVERHETLRTGLTALDGEPVQAVRPACRLPVTVLDRTGDDEADVVASIPGLVGEPFDLARPPLARVTLLRVGTRDQVLVLTFHHAVSDLWSGTVFFRELGACYAAFAAGDTPSLPSLPVQYGDYAAWERERQDGPEVAEQLERSRAHLEGVPALDLASDRPRPPMPTYRGAAVFADLPARLVRDVDALGREQDATRFMVLLAAFESLLARHSGQRDFAVGTPFAGRTRVELEGLVGFFATTLVLRADLSARPTFAELVSRTRETCLDAYARSEVPFERLVERLRPARDLSRPPVFQVMFSLENAPPAGMELAGLPAERVELEPGTAKFDLFLAVATRGDGLRASLEYNADLFDADTARRMLAHLQTLLTAALADPHRPVDELDLLDAGEVARLEGWGRGPCTAPPDTCLPQLVEAVAARRPDAVAVESVDGTWTVDHAWLDARANRLALRLRALGLGPGDLVAVHLDRDPELVVALLGVLRAGAAYLPVDPGLPAGRIRFVLEDSAAALVLTSTRLRDGLPETAPPVLCPDTSSTSSSSDTPLEPVAGPDDLAYVIYTSGSTGRPKGVRIRHGALVNFLDAMAERPGLGEGDVLAAVTTVSFDIAALELYLPLLVGGRVALVSREDAADGARLAERLAACGATAMQATPVTWQLLLDAGWVPPTPFTVLCGGEALPTGLAHRLVATGATVWNLYGPTETTIWSTAHRLDGTEDPVPLGTPIANTELRVVDERGRCTPVGVPGELVIGGAGVASGYHDRPGLTAERFVENPRDPYARRYRTGDLVRYRATGELDYLGRADDQLKIRGFRIEPGEVEAVLCGHPGVREAVVVARDDHAGTRRLVAYVVPSDDEPATPDALRRHARAELPDYMVPTQVVPLDALPLTPNGKVDRSALPGPDVAPTAEHVPPRTPAEERLARIFVEATGRDGVGVHDDFFEIGGHSLLAARVVGEVERAFGVEIGVRELFARPTVAELATAVDPQAPPDRGGSGPDLRADVWLDPRIVPAGPVAHPATPEQVFVTGATGFLGAFLLGDVLDRTGAVAHCLVRGDSAAAAQDRLETRLRALGIWRENWSGRVRAVAGSLSAPGLGLDDATFDRLADEVDEVYHVGAQVNFLRPYRALAASNVGGTREVLRLAASGSPASLQHVSTISVLPPQRDGERPYRADHLPGDPPAENGYGQSKWVAEQVVALARERGLPVTVHRPGRVAGHTVTGLWNTDDVMARVFRASVVTGVVPDVAMSADLLPVDYVAGAIARLARLPGTAGGTFGFGGVREFRLDHMAAVLGDLGHLVRLAPFEEWLDACRRGADTDADLGATASLLAARVDQHRRGLRDPVVDSSGSDRLLGDELGRPVFDDESMRRCLRYLTATGFLPEPPDAADRRSGQK